MKDSVQFALKMLKVISIIGVIQLLVWYVFNGRLTWNLVSNVLFYNFYYGLPLFMVNSLPAYINPTWSKGKNEISYPKLIFNFFLGILFSFVTLVLLNFVLWVVIEGKPMETLFVRGNRGSYVIGLVISIITSLIYHSIFLYKALQEKALTSEKLEKEKINLEHQSLRAHVDPHFLFNSFNVLSGLIDENPEQAQRFLSRLSKVYRHVLEQREDEQVTIQKELDFARNYVDLLTMRFQDAVKLTVDVEEKDVQRYIAPLSLQLLVENAVKHNALNSRNRLDIEIYSEDGYLVVRNNVLPKQTIANSSGFGLENIRQRYELLTDKEVVIDKNDTHFTVKLPML